MTTIGILIPLCSRKQKWVNVLDIDFFNNFLPYFYSTISNKYNYRFYFAIDENDKFLNDNREDIERCLNEDDKIIIAPKEYNGNQNNGNWFALPKDVQTKILKEKLNSSDYRYFRTAPGKF